MSKLLILISVISYNIYSCSMEEVDIQKKVFDKLVNKYRSDKEKPLKSVRKIDFLPNKRVRFLYVSDKIATKNIVNYYNVSKQCSIEFKEFKF